MIIELLLRVGKLLPHAQEHTVLAPQRVARGGLRLQGGCSAPDLHFESIVLLPAHPNHILDLPLLLERSGDLFLPFPRDSLHQHPHLRLRSRGGGLHVGELFSGVFRGLSCSKGLPFGLGEIVAETFDKASILDPFLLQLQWRVLL